MGEGPVEEVGDDVDEEMPTTKELIDDGEAIEVGLETLVGVADFVLVGMIEEDEAAAFPALLTYSVSPAMPPQISFALPPQSILHLPFVA